MKNHEFSLGREELVYLLWLLKYPTLPGLGQKPLGDATSDQTEAMLATAERSLQARGWLEILEDGVTHVDPDLANIIHKSGDPVFTIYFSQRKAQGDGTVAHFYLNHDSIIQHTSQKPGIHILRTLSSIDDVFEETLGVLDINYVENDDNSETTIADSLIAAARQSTTHNGPATAQEMLIRNGIGEKFAGAFAQALENPLSEINLIGIHKGTNVTDELLFLEAPNGVWILEPALDEPGLYLTRIRTITGEQAQTSVREWLQNQSGLETEEI